jgi:hypothetical protein
LKQIETLEEDIASLFKGHSLDDVLTANLGSELTNLFTKRFKEYGEEKKPYLRLSNIGWPLRKLWYYLNGTKGEELPVDAKVKFLYGDLLESLFIFLATQAGHTVEGLQKEVEFEGIKGRTDCIIDGVLVDVKSCSTFSYNKFVDSSLYENDPFGYVFQLKAYKEALGAQRAGWLIIDKVLGHFKFVEFKEPNLPQTFNSIVQKVKSEVVTETEPSRCYEDKLPSKKDKSGNRVLSTGCSYCQYKFHCWRDANNGQGLLTRIYSTGPKYFTLLVKEPRLKYEEFQTKEESE